MRAPPKKRFGQHFLHDRGVVQRIVARFAPTAAQTVVEIGPGRGALTTALLDVIPRLHAVELDRDLLADLQTQFGDRGLTLHHADALRFDFCACAPGDKRGEKLRVIGNLPYNISTPILFHLLDQVHCIADMCFMLQKEVVDRMCAPPGGKDYGRLSVMIQTRCAVTPWFNVAPGAFQPPPQVDSTIVHLRPHATPPVTIRDQQRFAHIVQAAFAQRRKTLRNSLRDWINEADWREVGIDPIRRAETLSLEEFAAISNLPGNLPG